MAYRDDRRQPEVGTGVARHVIPPPGRTRAFFLLPLIVAVTAIVAVRTSGHVYMACRRDFRGDDVWCVAASEEAERKLSFHLGPFGERNVYCDRREGFVPGDRVSSSFALRTSDGEIRDHLIDESFCSEAREKLSRFANDPDALRLVVDRDRDPLLPIAVGSVLFLVVLLSQRSRRIVVDHDQRLVRVGRREWTFADLSTAEARPSKHVLDLLLIDRAGKEARIARGEHDRVGSVAEAINRALRQRA